MKQDPHLTPHMRSILVSKHCTQWQRRCHSCCHSGVPPFQLKDLWWASRETLASYLITWSYIVRLSHNTHACWARAEGNRKEAPWVLWLQHCDLHLWPHPHTEIAWKGWRMWWWRDKRTEKYCYYLQTFPQNMRFTSDSGALLFPLPMPLPDLIGLARWMMMVLYNLQNAL